MPPFYFVVRNPQDFSIAAGKKIPIMPEGSLLASSRRESMGILRSLFSLASAIIFYAKSIIEGEKSVLHQLPRRKISRRNDTRCGTEKYFIASGTRLGSENSARFQG